jgi:hypothetical protein
MKVEQLAGSAGAFLLNPNYPKNDITAELQASAAAGGTYTLTADSVFHQVVAIKGNWTLDLNGFTLQMFGRPHGRLVYGQLCTGPAAWFLDSQGNPIGYPTATHPAGDQFNAFYADKTGLTITFGGGTFDDNIGNLTDVWAGAVVGPTNNPTLISDGLTIINNYGGYNGAIANPALWCPDPIHIDGNGCQISNYTIGVTNRVALDPDHPGTVPEGLVGGDATHIYTGISVSDVTIGIGHIEFDGIMSGAKWSNITVQNGHVSFASSVPVGSWGGALMTGWNITAPGTSQVLDFAVDGSCADMTIGESGAPCVFSGTITNPTYFAGTWYSGNTPSSP